MNEKTLRQDAEKWRDLAAQDGGADLKAEQTLAMLNEIARLRAAVTALGGTICPRCEGQRYDVGACGLCRNLGWLDTNSEALDG